MNCQLGSFPFKYLGIAISRLKLGSSDFAPSVLKVVNRVMPWRGRYNSFTGKVCLINACLSSLPMFLMVFYRLSEGTHAGNDKHCSGFYWSPAYNKKMYRLVKWKIMFRPKSLGGLGIINTYIMNKCLIIKWWWRILNTSLGVLWFDILKAKYFPSSSPLLALACGGSQFWHDLNKLRDEFRSHVKFVVHNGEFVCFCLDWWHGDSPLRSSFLVLFSYCANLEISLATIGIWGSVWCCLLQSWRNGTVSLPSSLCFWRLKIR